MKTSLLGKTWHVKRKYDTQKSLVENLLLARGFSKKDFSEARYEDLLSPFQFSHMQKVVERIMGAIEGGERILIFGDYDLDGMSSVAMVLKTLRYLGAAVSFRLPSRADGYGLSEHFVKEAIEHNVKVIITTDCGIADANTIADAQRQAIDVIITDHHSIPEILPPAYAILHPLIKEETFPDKALTGAGVALFLCLGLLRGKKGIAGLIPQLLELAALGTVADCGILLGQNRLITLLGIEALKTTYNPGLKKLFEISRTDPQKITAETIAFYLAPRLNASGRIAHPKIGLELLLGNPDRALELELLNTKRQDMVTGFLEEAEEMLGENVDTLPSIIAKNAKWPSGVIGLIAGKLAEKYDRPAVIFEEGTEKMTASCRGVDDFDLMEALGKIAHKNPDMFLGFGGHKKAAGFSLRPKNFSDFQKSFLEIVEIKRGKTPPAPKLSVDYELNIPIDMEDIRLLNNCEPFGTGNPAPCFLFSEIQIVSMRKVGSDEKHLSMKIQNTHDQIFSGIFFGQGALYDILESPRNIELVACPSIREWQGNEEVQLKIADIRIVG